MTQSGRTWPAAEAFDATVNLSGYTVKGTGGDTSAVPLSALFHDLPVAVLKARYAGATKPARKRSHAET
jgi:(1->4)-alpha-D-glucan 1-alpha-D-glucosylmutase